jgi:hypothetical protein
MNLRAVDEQYVDKIRHEYRPYSGPSLQCPTSCDSLPLSPISSYKLPSSNGDYLPYLESFTFDYKACQPWMHSGDSANNTRYSSTSTQSMNMGSEAAIDEFQHSGIPSKSDTPMALFNGPLLFQTSMADPQFPQVSQISQSKPDSLPTRSPSWPQPQPSSQAKQQIALNPQLSATEISKLLTIAMPTRQAPESPKLPQRVEDRRKRLSSRSHPSTSSSTSPKPRKIGHSVIEKRYRTNINEKIALLRDSIPSLRIPDRKIPNSDTAVRGSQVPRNMKKVC